MPDGQSEAVGRKRNAGMMGAGVARVPDGTARWLLLVPLLAFAGCATTTEEAGAWRIEACGPTGEGDLMVFPGPDGREVACWGYVS